MATKRWVANAAYVTDLWTMFLSGTVTSQTFTITINGKTATYVAGGGDTVATVLAGLVTSFGASLNPEFAELVASGVPAAGPFTSAILTGRSPGKPSVVTVSTSGAATFTIANTTAATGPTDFTNGQNWSGGSAPANNDTLVFDAGSTPCKYNIGSSLTGVTVNVNPGYSGTIGLPAINNDSNSTYNEYRTTSLTLAGGTVIVNAPLVTRCNLAFGANTSTVRVLNTGQRQDQFVPVVLVIGGNASSELDITKGDVGLAFYLGSTANFPVIRTSYASQPQSDAVLLCGEGTSLGLIYKNGGILIVKCNMGSLIQGPLSGVTTVIEGLTTNTLDIQGGSLIYNSSGTITTLRLSNGAVANFDGDPRLMTITNTIQMYGDKASIIDNQKRINTGALTVQLEYTNAVNIQHGVGSLVVMS